MNENNHIQENCTLPAKFAHVKAHIWIILQYHIKYGIA